MRQNQWIFKLLPVFAVTLICYLFRVLKVINSEIPQINYSVEWPFFVLQSDLLTTGIDCFRNLPAWFNFNFDRILWKEQFYLDMVLHTKYKKNIGNWYFTP